MLLGDRYIRRLHESHERVRAAIAAYDAVLELTGAPDAATIDALGEAIKAEGKALEEIAETVLGDVRRAGIQAGARC